MLSKKTQSECSKSECKVKPRIMDNLKPERELKTYNKLKKEVVIESVINNEFNVNEQNEQALQQPSKVKKKVSHGKSAEIRMKKYLQIVEIGTGSFGKAVLVKDVTATENREKKLYVMKMIDIARLGPKERRDAINEIRVLSFLKHPYIISYKESFVENGCICIVMEYADRGDLFKAILRQKNKKQHFSESQIVRWITQVTLALKYIHENHVLHRDLKSQNLFLTSSGRLCLGDFGIAKLLGETSAFARTQVGTPYYLSPEICQNRPYSWASDIWALGCILYELATLEMPFNAPNIGALLTKITRQNPPPLPAVYSASLQRLYEDCLNRDWQCRPTAADILQRNIIKTHIQSLLTNQYESQCYSQSVEGNKLCYLQPSSYSQEPPPCSVRSKGCRNLKESQSNKHISSHIKTPTKNSQQQQKKLNGSKDSIPNVFSSQSTVSHSTESQHSYLEQFDPIYINSYNNDSIDKKKNTSGMLQERKITNKMNNQALDTEKSLIKLPLSSPQEILKGLNILKKVSEQHQLNLNFFQKKNVVSVKNGKKTQFETEKSKAGDDYSNYKYTHCERKKCDLINFDVRKQPLRCTEEKKIQQKKNTNSSGKYTVVKKHKFNNDIEAKALIPLLSKETNTKCSSKFHQLSLLDLCQLKKDHRRLLPKSDCCFANYPMSYR